MTSGLTTPRHYFLTRLELNIEKRRLLLYPTLENTIVWMWLRLLHPGLPSHVSLRYGPVLRNKTLLSIRNEISAALPPLLSELETNGNAKVFYKTTQL